MRPLVAACRFAPDALLEDDRIRHRTDPETPHQDRAAEPYGLDHDVLGLKSLMPKMDLVGRN